VTFCPVNEDWFLQGISFLEATEPCSIISVNERKMEFIKSFLVHKKIKIWVVLSFYFLLRKYGEKSSPIEYSKISWA